MGGMKTPHDKLTCKIFHRNNTVCPPPKKNPVFSKNLAFLDQFSCSLTDERTFVVVELLLRLKTWKYINDIPELGLKIPYFLGYPVVSFFSFSWQSLWITLLKLSPALGLLFWLIPDIGLPKHGRHMESLGISGSLNM